ncbi:MAG TPA: NAD(P)-dependent oxidoreductase [Candidatus Methylacidiphilales bacterium]|jgi:3-hydroxyisobutyrate dehydrogenase-like beta-hydroxyacid dehydrogenase|nr:NAD(P)-dependent oxidoreductase [Candidatus Methylacidiphilales bacterium]
MQNIAIAGLGIIGSAWAQNLHEDGFAVRGWNRTPKDFPFYEPDLVTAVTDAEMIIIVVADPPAVESVLNVIVPYLQPGQLVVQSSTISAYWTRLFAGRVEAAGGEYLEAPFTGSKPAAEARETVFYLGGMEYLVEKARPVLERLGSHLLHIGPTSAASSLKLAMNLNIALVMEALSESLTLARAAGISDEIFFDALHINAGRSGISDLKEQKLMTKDYSPEFSLKHMFKDLRLALETAGNLDLHTAKALKALYTKGMEAGYGGDDFTGMIRLLAHPNKLKK